jgi:hypothetical protein
MRADEILASWRDYYPKEALLSDVLLVAESKFESVTHKRRGGYCKIFDSRLKRLGEIAPDFLPDCMCGNYSIPTRKGRKVKGHYVRRIVELIDLVDEMSQRGY